MTKMPITKVKDLWESLSKSDPLWAILVNNRQWNLEDFFETGSKEVEQLFENLNKHNIQINRGMALDFGCGVGRTSRYFAKIFTEVHGVDVSENMIELAKRYNPNLKNCYFQANQYQNLSSFESNQFDFIYSNRVFQHLEDGLVDGYLTEFERVAKHGGIVVFRVIVRMRNPILNFIRNNILVKKIIYRLYLKIRYGSNKVMETYASDPAHLRALLASLNCSVIFEEDDSVRNEPWIGKTFYVRKNSANL